MKYRIFFIYTFLSLLLSNVNAKNTGGDILQRIISIDVKKQTLELALTEIKNQGGFSFSYNPSILDIKQIVTYKGQNVTVKAVLNELLGYNYEFKQIGSHIIIREALTLTIKPIDQRKRKTKTEIQRLKENILLKGRVVDETTGIGLKNVVVYDEQQKVLTLSDSMGYYALNVPLERMQKGVYFRNRGYFDTMVQFNPSNEKEEVIYNIGLTPHNENSTPIDSDLALTTQSPHQLNVVKRFVPKKVDIISNSIEYVEYRTAQFTFIPFLSNNNFLGGSYTNRLSLNVYLGYSAGVDRGVEVGGLVNINRFHMKGFQLAGLSNIVGGDTHGFQSSGLVNYNMGKMKGIQVGGIMNVVKDSITGIQVGGINNVARENVNGLQVAGIANTTRTAVKGLQLSGIYNYSKSVNGIQVGGIYNTNQRALKGIQLAGIANYSQDIVGGQVSGIFNQVTGVNKGLQLAALLNYAKEQKGVQLGLFNFAKKGENGIPIGLFSYYNEGYHSLEYFVDEFSSINLTFRSGSKKLYTYYTFGTSYGIPNIFPEYKGVGLGMGLGTFLFKRVVFEAGFQSNFNFNDDIMDYHYIKSSLIYIQPIWKGISLNVGPTFNYNTAFFGGKENVEKITPPSFYSSSNDKETFWISGKVGLIFTW